MKSVFITLIAGLLAAQPKTVVQEAPDEFASLSAREIVREGNRRLAEGDAGSALAAYERAGQLAPDAREIAFALGLAQFDLRKFDEARASFRQAAATANDALATDAQYSLGACDHVEALENTDDPELAMSLLESAMRRYHGVLDEQPNHEAAQDANYKAASVWRKIKEIMEQQPPPQDCDNENDEKTDDENEGDEEKKSKPSNQDQDQQEQDQKQESSAEEESQAREQEQQSAEQKKEQVSREQAERQLREMMQALRQRQKARKQPVMMIPVAPVEKDW